MLDWIRKRRTLLMRVGIVLIVLQLLAAGLIGLMAIGVFPGRTALLFVAFVLFVVALPATVLLTLLGTRIMYPAFYERAEPVMDDEPDEGAEGGRHTRPGWSNPEQGDH